MISDERSLMYCYPVPCWRCCPVAVVPRATCGCCFVYFHLFTLWDTYILPSIFAFTLHSASRYIVIAIFGNTLHCTLSHVFFLFFFTKPIHTLPQLVRKIVLYGFFVCFVGARCFLFDFCIFAEMRLTICLFYFSSRLRVKFCPVPTNLPAAKKNLSHRPTCPVSCKKRKPQGLFPIPFVRPNVWCSDLSCLEMCCSKKFIVYCSYFLLKFDFCFLSLNKFNWFL